MEIRKTRRKRGKYVMWINPVTGDYRVPAADDQEMPLRYRMQGFEVKEFTSYFEHKRWMASKGLVCHATEDIKDDNDIQLSRWGY